jgi:hypothetical protein
MDFDAIQARVLDDVVRDDIAFREPADCAADLNAVASASPCDSEAADLVAGSALEKKRRPIRLDARLDNKIFGSNV